MSPEAGASSKSTDDKSHIQKNDINILVYDTRTDESLKYVTNYSNIACSSYGINKINDSLKSIFSPEMMRGLSTLMKKTKK
jgi:hypothetical protein